jgi:hypothetical protein
MKIAIIGTRGIPNNYGGFEQFAEYLSVGLMEKGYEVVVYNSHLHEFKGTDYKGVKIIHQYDPEFKYGTFGQFIYDRNCIKDSRKRNFDIIYQLGYTSNSIWGYLLPKKPIIVTNMDGLEWKRSKYSSLVKKFLKFAEKLAIRRSDYLISDSLGIQKYLKLNYKVESKYIPYGACLFTNQDETVLLDYGLRKYEYDILIARLEPENSIDIILEGVLNSNVNRTFVVIGNYNTKYGKYLIKKYISCSRIKFIGPLFNIEKLNNLRFFSNLYFHGHTVGGTNPSLLEAMSSEALICAHNNEFNKTILKDDAFYFSSSREVSSLLLHKKSDYQLFVKNNLTKMINLYSWDIILEQYDCFFKDIFKHVD